MTMRLMSCLVASAVLLSGCGPASPEMQVIEDVAEALGGMRAVQNAKTVVIQGRGTNFRLGQNEDPDASLPEYKISEFTWEIDLVNGRWRQEQLRTSNFFTDNPLVDQRQIIAVDGDVAFDISEDGTARRASSQVARDRQAELYHYPVSFIQAATAEGATVSNLLQEDGQDVVDITTAEGTSSRCSSTARRTSPPESCRPVTTPILVMSPSRRYSMPTRRVVGWEGFK